MITNIWLKSQPRKIVKYPNCSPHVANNLLKVWIVDHENKESVMAEYLLASIVRIEFRPE